MTDFTFSGKFAKIDLPELKRLFGPTIPIEAVDLLFTAFGHKTLGEVRAEIEAMAKVWDPVAVHFMRLDHAIGAMSNTLSETRKRLGVMREETGDRLWGLEHVIDAAEVMEAADQDLSACLRQDDY